MRPSTGVPARPNPGYKPDSPNRVVRRSRKPLPRSRSSGNVTRFFSGIAQYTLSRAYNDVGGARGINTFPANNWNPDGEWARADFDARHRLNLLGSINSGRPSIWGCSFAE